MTLAKLTSRASWATKLGMTQLWDENNKVVPVTVVAAAGPCDRDPGSHPRRHRRLRVAIQVGFGEIEGAQGDEAVLKGHFAKADVTPRRHLVEIRTSDASVVRRSARRSAAELFAVGRQG
jgi:large subunit ribosomal protein L3